MEGFLLLGRHPKLSTFIQMFFTVSLKFLMFLAWYISIIIAFGFAFFFILSQQDGNDYFKNPEKSMLKTVVMSLTGELEFEGIDFGGPDAVFGKLVSHYRNFISNSVPISRSFRCNFRFFCPTFSSSCWYWSTYSMAWRSAISLKFRRRPRFYPTSPGLS